MEGRIRLLLALCVAVVDGFGGLSYLRTPTADTNPLGSGADATGSMVRAPDKQAHVLDSPLSDCVSSCLCRFPFRCAATQLHSTSDA